MLVYMSALTILLLSVKIPVMMNSGGDDPLNRYSLSTQIGYISGPTAKEPGGVRVVEPPPGTRQHQRGNFYAIVELQGGHPDSSGIADHLLTILQRTYYGTKGSQSQVMMEAMGRARQSLQKIVDSGPDYRVDVGMLCAALLGSRLIVLSSGPTFALVRTSDKVHMFPSEIDVSAGMQAHRPAGFEIYRQDMRSEDALFLGGGSWLSHLTIDTLAGYVAYLNAENCAAAADQLFSESGGTGIPGLLIVLDTGDAAASSGSTRSGPGPSAARPRRPRFGGLPTALSAAPPVQVPSSGPLPIQGSVQVAVAEMQLELPSEDEPVTASVDEESDLVDAFDQEDEAVPSLWPLKMTAAVTAGFGQARGLFSRMLPDSAHVGGSSFEAPSIESKVVESSVVVAPTLVPEVAVDDFESAGDDVPADPKRVVPTPVPEMEPFTPPEPARGARARIFILLALVILAVVPVVVGAVNWGAANDRRADAEQLTDAAEAALVGAQLALDIGDKPNARERLVEGRRFVIDAIDLNGNSERRSQLFSTINAELQEVMQVQPLYGLAEPLVTFPGEARPHRVLVADDDIYVLDTGRQAVIRFRYDPAVGRILDEEGQMVLRQDDVVDGVPVGTLADMAWLPLIPGVEDKAMLLVLDRNNNLFSYDQRVEGARRIDLSEQAEWDSAAQVQTYLGRIYVGDEGASEIYRYSPSRLDDPPDDWFSEQTMVNLAGMISLQIDGDIWVLLNNGSIMRYNGGEQVPFSLENSIGLADEPVDLYVTTQDASLVYMADAGENRVLVYGKDGSYRYQLTSPEDDLLRGLSGVYVDEVDGTMYLLTKSALFKHPVFD